MVIYQETKFHETVDSNVGMFSKVSKIFTMSKHNGQHIKTERLQKRQMWTVFVDWCGFKDPNEFNIKYFNNSKIFFLKH